MAAKTLDVALIGGPQYDALSTRLALFAEQTGYQVRVHAQLAHPELNRWVAQAFASGSPRLDLISTHVKYVPSQRPHLLPLDDEFSSDELSAFSPAMLALCRVEGRLLQVPRTIDARILLSRKDLLEDPNEQAAFQRRYQRPLGVPATWTELRDVATFFTRPPDLYGFAYPGHSSGLFGTFYELVVMAGGNLFDEALRPTFDTPASRWALGYLADLYQQGVTPRDLSRVYFDEVSQLFREGKCALVTDWPAFYGLLTDPRTSTVADRFDAAIYPVGPAGKRAVYAGGHSFALPVTVKDRAGALALLRFLTSEESQYTEAKRGAIVPRLAVMERIRAETPPGTVHARRLAALEETIQHHLLTFPHLACYPEIEEAGWQTLQAAILGQATVGAALRYLQDQVAQILAKR